MSRSILLLVTVVLGYPRALVLRPFLDAANVEDGPAGAARPDLRVATDFVSTYGTFVDAVGNVFLGTCGYVWGSRA